MSIFDDVCEFLQIAADQRGAHQAQLETLINNCTDIIERETGRKITLLEVEDYKLTRGVDFGYYGQSKIYLNGALHDIVAITKLIDRGKELTAGVDYILDKNNGLLIKEGGEWLENIVITGKFGLVVECAAQGENDEPVAVYEPIPALKQVLIEMVAAKSGLWKMNVETESGTITQTRTTINKDTQALLNKFRLVQI
ncbi:hypothetical protein NO1_1690 [Candidatus Termititenax aidoneus]|uniref:Uncharacterized protein n=1 Tax=Termititenax aidoneus TaxID=2218524 RepID=A0A388TDK8_TERA1|nr:hypothetical protein NO1_1690 [Candidatus Termititenax aidoneus]